MSCILRHCGVELILAYSWARPAILVAGKGRRNVFMPPPFSMGGHIVSPLSVRTYVPSRT